MASYEMFDLIIEHYMNKIQMVASQLMVIPNILTFVIYFFSSSWREIEKEKDKDIFVQKVAF